MVYNIGTRISDVTAPAIGQNMQGMADPSQKITGVESRLYARTFVITDDTDPDWNKPIVIVIADMWASVDTTWKVRAIAVVNSVQLEVLKAKTRQKLPTILTVAWAVEAVAYLGGYLEHRRKTPIGIQVLWRGWLKLHDLCEGWELARNT